MVPKTELIINCGFKKKKQRKKERKTNKKKPTMNKVIMFNLQIVNCLYFIQCFRPKVYLRSSSNKVRHPFSVMYGHVHGMKEHRVKGSEESHINPPYSSEKSRNISREKW